MRTEDWIEDIVDTTYENYRKRKIVLWGKYEVSDIIRKRLEVKYEVETAFYVESDITKTDGQEVRPVEWIYGKSSEYYIVIPLSYYPSVKECLIQGGYESIKDCYYFNDCILCEGADYYEDAHGNKIIGNYQGLKFAFSGFHSVITIGKGVRFQNTRFYIHNDSSICIGEGVQFSGVGFHLCNGARIDIGIGGQFVNSDISMKECSDIVLGNKIQLIDSNIKMEASAYLEIKQEGYFRYLLCSIEKQAFVLFHEKILISASEYLKSRFLIMGGARLEIGCGSRFWGNAGMIVIEKAAALKIGRKFSVGDFYRLNADSHTEITIGDDCLFSHNITMRGNDGHSIFDIITGENINSSYKIAKSRKIVIGNHVWIGMETIILYGARISDGSIIGSMSLVKGFIPNNCIAAGIPAKVLRKNIAWCHEAGADDIKECGEKYIHLTEDGEGLESKNENLGA